jgi:site-specific DNA-methyltransferase (adenine-specific)
MDENDRKVMFSHATDEYQTPKELFDLLDKEFHFNVDAAANLTNTKCPVFMDNALECDCWTKTNEVFFLNPPHSKLKQFLFKAYIESLKGATVVCLIPARTDTQYFHNFCMRAKEIRFIKGRLKFELPGKVQINTAPFPSIIVVFSKTDQLYPKISSYLY